MAKEDVMPDAQGHPDRIDQAPGINEPDVSLTLDDGDDADAVGTDDSTPDIQVDDQAAGDSTDWQKRYTDLQSWATQINAQNKSIEGELKALRERETRFNQAGINLNELEPLLEEQGGARKTPPGEGSFVTKEQFSQAVQNVSWMMEKQNFIASNSAFKDPDLGAMLDNFASQVAMEEMRQFGAVRSAPSQLLQEGAKRSATLIKKLRGEGKKKATEQRQKISQTGVIEGGQKKAQKSADDEEVPDARKDWVNNRRNVQERANKLQT